MKTIVDEYGVTREVIGTCGCGRPLIRGVYFTYKEDIHKSVTHTIEDEEHHIKYFSGIKVLLTNFN